MKNVSPNGRVIMAGGITTTFTDTSMVDIIRLTTRNGSEITKLTVKVCRTLDSTKVGISSGSGVALGLTWVRLDILGFFRLGGVILVSVFSALGVAWLVTNW